VAPPPATLSLAYLGKVRDKVGGGNAAFGPDGGLDGSFQVTVGAGSGARTVTRLELRGGGGVWDTDTATAHWALGATLGLDSALLNGGNGAVSFGVTDGSVFYVFASDLSSAPFSSGAVFTITANFADGTTASATVTLPVIPTITSVTPSTGAPGTSPTVTVAGTNFQTGATAAFGAGITVGSTTVGSATQLTVALTIGSAATLGPRDVVVTNPNGQSATRSGGFTVAPPPPTVSLAYLGKLRDKVGAGPSPNGALDGTFQVTFEAGSGARTVTRLELRSSGGVWDTDPATPHWVLGASVSLDSALLNAANGAVSFGVADGGVFHVFASYPNSAFTPGRSFTLTVIIADTSAATVSTTIP